MDPNHQFLGDRIPAELDGEEITIWNRVTVDQHHVVRFNEIESHHRILAGDGSSGEVPEYVTPAIDDQLRSLDVYPAFEVLDPADDEVTIL